VTAATTEAPRCVNPMLPALVRVRDFRPETHDTFTLSLAPTATSSFQAGQFNMLYVFGIGEVPISMSSDPALAEKGIEHTIRGVGAVTNALGKLRAGDCLGVRGPFGSTWPLDAARGRDVVLVAGGIGLAPLRPAIYHLLRHRADFGRVVLLYGARTPADGLYSDELRTWAARPDFQVLTTVDRGNASWHGPVGVVTLLFAQAQFDPARAVGLMCGPEVMMRFTIREFQSRGVTDDRLYVSLERNMQCAIGLCGHCQFGPSFVCVDGPVFRYDRVQRFFNVQEA